MEPAMTMIFAIHAPKADQLEAVKAEMADLGAPEIHVVNCADYFMALEGSHRLAAAEQLGLTPTLIIHEQNDLIDISGYDWFDPANWASTEYPAGEVAGELFSPQAVGYRF